MLCGELVPENRTNMVGMGVKRAAQPYSTDFQAKKFPILKPLEKITATHSSILAWRIPWTVQPMGLQRVGHD